VKTAQAGEILEISLLIVGTDCLQVVICMQEKIKKTGKIICYNENLINSQKMTFLTCARTPRCKNGFHAVFLKKCKIVSGWKKLSFTEFCIHNCLLLLSIIICYLYFFVFVLHK